MLDAQEPLAGHARCQWIVVNTQAHRETTVLFHLKRQGYVTYCPEIERTISHARRKQVVRRPLFPGYCFVGTDPLVTQWRPILSTFGVRRIVRFGEQMGYLPPNFIAALRAREINGLVCRPPSPFGPGESVRIKEGAFEGVVAQILEIGENDRIKVLLELLQLPVKIDVNVRDLAKI